MSTVPTRLAWLLLAVLLLAARAERAHAEESAPTEAAVLQVTAEPSRCVVGQQVRVTLIVRYLPEHFRDHAASLFRRPLDLEVQLAAPWLRAQKGAVVLPVGPYVVDTDPGSWLRLALNGEVASLPRQGPVQAGGRTWMTLTAGCTLVPTEAGTLELAAPTLTYAFAERIEENLMGERTASASSPVLIEGSATSIVVTEPPAAGRPAGFTGAVGRFDVEARVASPEVEVGTPFELTLVISGDGNLGLIEQPRLDALAGFHVYGAKEEPPEALVPTRRVIRYEIALTDGALRAVPPVPFAYFDPADGAYKTARSAAIPLRVRAGAAPTSDGAAAPPAEADAPGEEERPRPPPRAFLALAILAGLLVIGGGLAMLWRVRPRRQPAHGAQAAGSPPSAARPAAPRPAPGVARAQAQAALRAAAGADDADAAYRALVGFLAVHLACGAGAVVGAGLEERLLGRGVAPALAAQTKAALDALLAARYGSGGSARLEPGMVDALVSALA